MEEEAIPAEGASSVDRTGPVLFMFYALPSRECAARDALSKVDASSRVQGM